MQGPSLGIAASAAFKALIGLIPVARDISGKTHRNSARRCDHNLCRQLARSSHDLEHDLAAGSGRPRPGSRFHATSTAWAAL